MRLKKIGLSLLASSLAIGGLVISAPMLQPAWAGYSMDTAKKVITISPTGNYTEDARRVITFLVERPDKNVKYTVKFNPGRYYLTRPLYSVGLQNVDILSNPENPAKIIKAPDFSGSDYLFTNRGCKNVKIQGFEWYGKTEFKQNSNPVWPDQGILLASCNTVVVDQNKFFNFGNAPLRVTTSDIDPVKGVNSTNTIVTKNTFNNIYQLSTTSNSKDHGATSNYRFEGNTIVNLRGSIKFASRTPGAKNVKFLNNTINGSDHYGLEINNYDNFEIRGNQFQNIKEIAINIYTASNNDKMEQGFPWGDNFSIVDNTVQNADRGIRYSHKPFFDGSQNTPNNLVIAENTLENIKTTDKFIPAIAVIDGKINGVTLSNNRMKGVTNKNYITLAKNLEGLKKSGNVGDGKALEEGGQVSEQPDTTNNTGNNNNGSGSGNSGNNGAPATPTNVATNYDGKLAVRVTWKDNANNEARQEVWGSTDGKNYVPLAKIYANSTTFLHRMKKLPNSTYGYYAVKSVNSNGASSLSQPSRVTWKRS